MSARRGAALTGASRPTRAPDGTVAGPTRAPAGTVASPTRAAVVLVLALALAGCGAAPGVIAGAAGDKTAEVVARDTDGDRVARATLPASGRFALAYRHSTFHAPAEERFRAPGAGGGFALEAIASPHAGVLDYYELAGTRSRERGAWVLRPDRPPRFARLALAATPTGRRTLVVGATRIALWAPGGGVRHLRIGVEGSP